MNRIASYALSAAIVAAAAGIGIWIAKPSSQIEGVTSAADLNPVGAANAQESADLIEIEDMVLGNPDAAVTVVEYASYTCPHCATFHAGTFKELRDAYIDTGKIKFVYREVYFDRYGLWASMVARCGGEERFFGITDLIYTEQRNWTQGQPADIVTNLRTIGKRAGLTDETLDACLSDAVTAQSLVAWYEENAKADSITSTPSFVIDGTKYQNMTFDEFAEVIDAKLN